jgi:hypothetical protein
MFKTASSVAPSDSTVSEDAGIEPRTVVILALVVRRFNHSARSHPQFECYWQSCDIYWQFVPQDLHMHKLREKPPEVEVAKIILTKV